MTTDFIRPRLVLATTLLPDGKAGMDAMKRALSGGDVASVLIEANGRADAAFQDFAEGLVPIIQEAGAAAIVVDDTRCAGRVKADGVHVTGGDLEELGEALSRFSPRLIVGTSGFAGRHEALEAGEKMPDYLMFGSLGSDVDDAADADALDLAAWWAQIVEVPAILVGGGALDQLAPAGESGVEFIVLSRAVFGQEGSEAEAVAAANAVFDELEGRLAG
ncbi:thiamine phosphate synthase [Aureimonas fodinaquatilis]|uniref:Thiamine phosphate synthase n=1 Tax=Aureimonas fodinaquatilis TaxID=2565783 RepID=A0A5B0E195_9HYPH|nr:thiamine phosphate synthase [Aureimonas fodinaquatilis]KAA0972408.1 thiamine phosphate synthase [Aureimonas fodinaquatilis]